MEQNAEGVIWGRSPALGLDLCWRTGWLRFYDPLTMSYIRNLVEAEAVIDLEQAARRDAEALAQAAEARANAEAAARRQAEAAYEADRARIRQLEEELRRLQSEK